MEITLYNIQGFRGHFTYVIDDLITIINSKHNGVGKTTLFDCLRFLCDSTQVDKEEQEFFLNLDEPEGMFSVKKNGVMHGFAFQRNKPPVFFRQIDGEEVERSDTNFETASQDIGILRVNGSLLNIFSKEVNLFSSSNTAQNYQLVKEITTHQQTEEMLRLLESSIEYNKNQLSNLQAERRNAEHLAKSIPYYYCVKEVEDLLNNDFYAQFESLCDESLIIIGSLKEVPDLNFNSNIEEFEVVWESLNRLQATDFIVPNVSLLDDIIEVSEVLERMQPSIEADLSVDVLENLLDVCESLDNLIPSVQTLDLDVSVLESLDLVLEQFNKVNIVEEIDVSSSLPSQLANVCIKLGEMITACNQEERFTRLAEESKKSIASTRVQCPIREEVYLINGKCIY